MRRSSAALEIATPPAHAERVTPKRPYPGLRPFTESDADAALFYGREAESEIILANLLAARLTVLYGPSGAGKSSTLRAGVIHELGLAPDVDPDEILDIVVLVDRWDGDPVARVIERANEAVTDRWPEHADAPISPATPLHEALRDLEVRFGVRVLLVFDQFEEFFVYHPLGSDSRLDRELPRVLTGKDIRAHLLISLREDALAGLDRFKGRIVGLFDNRLALAAMSPSAAREAIERPLARFEELGPQGVAPTELEVGLADEVIRQLTASATPATGGKGAAPEAPRVASAIEPAYLQLVMTRLWEAEVAGGSRTLRIATLHALGDAAQIIGRHVEVATGRLSRPEQDVAARMFRFLVTPSGGKVALTAQDLALYADLPKPTVARVLEALAATESRLLRAVPAPAGAPDRTAYEIFHDALAAPILDWSRRLRERRLQRRVRRLRVALAAAVAIAAGLAIYLLNPAPLHRLELRLVDARFDVRGATAPDRDVVLVAVDRRTVRARGGAYPLPRTDHAAALRRILADRPLAVTYDIKFAQARPSKDLPLMHAIASGRGKVVLAAFAFDVDGATEEFGRHPANALLRQLHAHVGYSGIPKDPDGTLRHMYATVNVGTRRVPRRVPSLALLSANAAGWSADVPDRGWIDYSGSAGTVPTVPFVDVLRDRIKPGTFRNKVVVVGVTAPVGHDLHPTSADGGSTLPGPEIQANMISTIHHDIPLRDAAAAVVVALIVLVGILSAAITLLPRRWGLAAWIAALILLAIGAQLSFDAGVVVPVVALATVLVVGGIGGALANRPRVLALPRWLRRARSAPGNGHGPRRAARSAR
jgi:CHASE2 domain-containing sensor protein